MRESELLEHIYARSQDLGNDGGIVVGPGDDGAVVDLEHATIATVDQLVGGRHFDPESATTDQIARKAVARSVSDIAAMGGRPRFALVGACLPEGYPDADALFDRMAHWARRWGCPLVGGDIACAAGPLVLTTTVLGTAHKARGPVLRSQARPGDALFITGRLGGAVASGRHLAFEPRLDEARWLCDSLGEQLGAMIDVSDGLGRDAGRLATASNVRIEIDADRLPMHEGVSGWEQPLGEGEDYELAFSVRSGAELPACVPSTGVGLHMIGRVVVGQGCIVKLPDGSQVDAHDLGWDHGA